MLSQKRANVVSTFQTLYSAGLHVVLRRKLSYTSFISINMLYLLLLASCTQDRGKSLLLVVYDWLLEWAAWAACRCITPWVWTRPACVPQSSISLLQQTTLGCSSRFPVFPSDFLLFVLIPRWIKQKIIIIKFILSHYHTTVQRRMTMFSNKISHWN